MNPLGSGPALLRRLGLCAHSQQAFAESIAGAAVVVAHHRNTTMPYDEMMRERAYQLGRILEARGLPASTRLCDLDDGFDHAARLFVAHLPGYPTNMPEAEKFYSFVQAYCIEAEAELAFPGLSRETFGGTVTGPLRGGRLVVVMNPYGSGKSRFLHEIEYAATRRGLQTLSPSGSHWVPGSEAVDPSKLARTLHRLHRARHSGKQVAVLIDDYERFEKLPGSVKALKIAERYGYRIFVACADPTNAMKHDPTFPHGTYIMVFPDGSLREWRRAERERYVYPGGHSGGFQARTGIIARALAALVPTRRRTAPHRPGATQADQRAA